MEELDKRKLRLYKFMIDSGRKTIDEIPEPYKSAIESA